MPGSRKRAANAASIVKSRRKVEPLVQPVDHVDAVVPAAIWAPLAVPTHSEHTDPCWRALDAAIVRALEGSRRTGAPPKRTEVEIPLTWYVWARDFLVPIGSRADAAVTYEHHQQSIQFSVYDLHLLDHLREPRPSVPGGPATVHWHLLNRVHHPPDFCHLPEGSHCLHGSGCAVIPPMRFQIQPNPKPTNRAVTAVHFDHITLSVSVDVRALLPGNPLPPTAAELPRFAESSIRVVVPPVVVPPASDFAD